MDPSGPRPGQPLETEPLGEELVVAPVDVVVPGVEVGPRLELGRAAPDLPASDPTMPGQVVTRPQVLLAAALFLPPVAALIETKRVDVDLPARRVGDHEARRPFVALWEPSELRERRFEQGYVVPSDREVEVVVGARLHAEQRVHRPASVDPPADPSAIEPREDLEDVVGGHSLDTSGAPATNERADRSTLGGYCRTAISPELRMALTNAGHLARSGTLAVAMASTIYRSARDRDAMLAWYDASLARIRVPVEARWCRTRFGDTHVLGAGPESAPALVALHGWGGNALSMTRQIDGLSEEFRVFAVDTVGQSGKSADVRPPLAGPAYADWLCDVLDALGLERARFVGVSGGGWLILKLATLHSGRIERAVVISTAGLGGPTLSAGAIPATLWPILRPSRRSVAAFLRLTAAPGWSPSDHVLEAFERFFRHVAVLRLGAQPVFSDEQLRRITAPLLILEGEHERLFSPRRAVARARALIPGVRAEIVPGVGHLMTEERPDIINALIRDFLDD